MLVLMVGFFLVGDVPTSMRRKTPVQTRPLSLFSLRLRSVFLRPHAATVKSEIAGFASLRRRQFSPNKKQNDRANDRQDEARRMKRGAWCRFRKQASDQSANDRPSDAKQSRHDETHMLHTWHDSPCDQTDNETDNDGPNDV